MTLLGVAAHSCQIGPFLYSLVANYAAIGCHISLWPNATTFERSPRGNSPTEGAPVWCSQRPQHLRSPIEVIHGQRSLQFVVAKSHNI